MVKKKNLRHSAFRYDYFSCCRRKYLVSQQAGESKSGKSMAMLIKEIKETKDPKIKARILHELETKNLKQAKISMQQLMPLMTKTWRYKM